MTRRTERPIGLLVAGAVRHAADYATLLAEFDGVEIRGIAEESHEDDWKVSAAHDLAGRLGVGFRPLDTALSDPSLDLVLVTTEPTRHASVARRALAAGHHVLVDKPVATSAQAARDLAAAAVRHPGQVSGYVHRLFHPAAERARSLIDSGAVGLPMQLEATWISANDVLQEGAQVVVDRELSGGGELRNFLGYPLDLILWLTGLPVSRIHAVACTGSSALHQQYGAESLAILTLELEGGAQASIAVGRGPAVGAGVFEISVVGSHGTIMLDETKPSPTISSGSHQLQERDAPGTFKQVFLDCVRDLISAIDDCRGGRQSQPRRSLSDGCEVAALIDLAYASLACGAPVSVVAPTTV